MAGLLYIVQIFRREQERNRRDLLRMHRRVLHDSMDPFMLSDVVFVKTFRLNKDAVRCFIEEVRQELVEDGRRTSRIPLELRVLCTLTFLASGSYQHLVGLSFFSNMSQPMVSRSIKQIVDASIGCLSRWVIFPSQEECENIKERFREQHGLPNVIGAVDGTHVAIIRPTTFPEEDYINRKRYHSLNVQIICDSRLRILGMNSSFPGRSHDSFVWRNSRACTAMEAAYRNGNGSFLLGDSGYPSQPWLLVPVLNAPPHSPQERYNIAHAVARSCVERCIGLLKGRFRCLLKARTLHYEPDRAIPILLTCAILHNIAIRFNSNIELLGFDQIDLEDDPDGNVFRIPQGEGNRIRARYIAANF